jgi:hypothetical protein
MHPLPATTDLLAAARVPPSLLFDMLCVAVVVRGYYATGFNADGSVTGVTICPQRYFW